MQIDAAVLVFAVLGLEIGDELAEGLVFLGHDVGEEKRVEHPVALGEVALEADAAGFLAPHDDLLGLHEIDDVFEADAVLVDGAAVPGADAVEHFGGVEGAGHVAGPAFVFEHPTEEDREDFVRVDEVAVLVGGADAVGVAVGAEAGVASVGDDCFAERADVGFDGLGVDAGKEGVDGAADLDEIDTETSEDAAEQGAARAIHGVDAEFEAGLGDEIEIGEFLNGGHVGGDEINFLDGCGGRGAGDGRAQVALNGGDDRRAAGAAEPCLVLDAVPLEGVVRGSNHDAAGRAEVAHGHAEGWRGGDFAGEADRDTRGGDNFRAGAGELGGEETRVVGDADAAGGGFGGVGVGVEVGCDGRCRRAHVLKGEVAGD